MLVEKFRESNREDKSILSAIDKAVSSSIMPPVSRFGGSGRTEKKQGIIDKLTVFFEKYFGLA